MEKEIMLGRDVRLEAAAATENYVTRHPSRYGVDACHPLSERPVALMGGGLENGSHKVDNQNRGG